MPHSLGKAVVRPSQILEVGQQVLAVKDKERQSLGKDANTHRRKNSSINNTDSVSSARE